MKIYNSLSFFRAAAGYAVLAPLLLVLLVSLLEIAPDLIGFLLQFWPAELVLTAVYIALLFYEDHRNNKMFVVHN